MAITQHKLMIEKLETVLGLGAVIDLAMRNGGFVRIADIGHLFLILRTRSIGRWKFSYQDTQAERAAGRRGGDLGFRLALYPCNVQSALASLRRAFKSPTRWGGTAIARRLRLYSERAVSVYWCAAFSGLDLAMTARTRISATR